MGCVRYLYFQIQAMDATQKPVNIWQEAAKQKNKELVATSLEKILLVVGNSGVGKTSFLKVVRNEADSEVKSTYLLDYSYLRRGHARKQLIHCYEIASKTQSQIIPSLFTKDNFANVTVAICVDLSKPSTIMDDINEWLSILRKQVQNSLHEKIGMQQKFEGWLQKRKQENNSHEDSKSMVVGPLNIVVVGCKYDLYQKYETENRKWLSKALRYLSHINNASLFFCSTKNSTVGTQLRSSVLELIFQQRLKIIAQKDHLKPIYILRNQDSLSNIAVPSSGSISGLEVLRRQISGLFSAEQQKKKEGIDISKYFELKIQTLIESRKKQLAKISKGLNKRNIV